MYKLIHQIIILKSWINKKRTSTALPKIYVYKFSFNLMVVKFTQMGYNHIISTLSIIVNFYSFFKDIK
ncbi:MAG: hypothetical protein K0R94_1606 [Burkholderiales bacterium]|jgi:hypothetical protein|nr:hypothetical protein [Burkholderiales bacterium]